MLLMCAGALAQAPAEPGWGWASRDNDAMVEDQLARWSHAETGAGLVVRTLDQAVLLEKKSRQLRKVDTESALSPDRLARVVQRSQPDDTLGPTAYLGPADGVAPHVGRWVYLGPDRERVWWQVFWRQDDTYVQWIGWAPSEQFAGFATAMRALEASAPAPVSQTLLFDAGRAGCAARTASRGDAIRDSLRFEDARGALRDRWHATLAADPATSQTVLSLGELRAMGVLYRLAEDCVQAAARQERACRVYEGTPSSPESVRLQAAVVQCIDNEAQVAEAVDLALAPLMSAEAP